MVKKNRWEFKAILVLASVMMLPPAHSEGTEKYIGQMHPIASKSAIDQRLSETAKMLRSGIAKGRRDFTIEYRSVSGKRFGDISEWETTLHVKGDGTATLFRRRGPGNTHDLSPGKYEGNVADSSLIRFLDILAGGKIQSVPMDAPGPRQPISYFILRTSNQVFRYSWGFNSQPKPGDMDKVIAQLEDWAQDACPKVRWNVILDVERFTIKNGKVSARLKIENQGREVIRVTHPASAGLRKSFGLYLEYGEQQQIEEGYTPDPIEWITAPLKVGSRADTGFVGLEPGKPLRVEYSAELEGKAPRGWIGRFGFLHYFPADTVAGKPVFNGAVFSKELKW